MRLEDSLKSVLVGSCHPVKHRCLYRVSVQASSRSFVLQAAVVSVTGICGDESEDRSMMNCVLIFGSGSSRMA